MKETVQYVVFPNHDNGMRLHRALRAAGLKSQISPTPRQASKCCGISLIVKEEELEQVKACIREKGVEIIGITALEKDVNPNRDQYC